MYRVELTDSELITLMGLVHDRIARMSDIWRMTGNRDDREWDELFSLSVALRKAMDTITVKINIADELDGD